MFRMRLLFLPVKMDIWSRKLHVATWTVMNFLCVFSHEMTVRNVDLKLCENDRQVCVTDLRDCGPRPPSSVQKTLNMSCYYQISHKSMTCEWSEEFNSHVSLMFRSKSTIYSCRGIFNPVATLSITARIKNYMGSEIWSQPRTVVLYDVVKPSQPVLTALGSTADSVDVSWGGSSYSTCRLRYTLNRTHTWTKVPVSVPVHQDQTLTYTIKGLLPFTLYRAAVACREESGIWSDWSSDVTMRTLDRVPSSPPEVCYRVEKTDSGGSFLLHLMWKLDLYAGDHILGYQVSYEPAKKQRPWDGIIQNVTEVTALLVVGEENCTVTVRAFNTAGYGPAAHLSIDTQRQNTLPSVRNLWVSSFFPPMKSLLVQWKNPTASPSLPPVSHFAVQWSSETHPSTSSWKTVDSFNTSTVIQDVDPDESYMISVIPVYMHQCGSPQSLSASLQQGALMEVVKLKVVAVTKTTVTFVCVWQRKSGTIRVNGYRVMVRKDSERQKSLLTFPTLPLWPDQWQHTLPNLKPNTEYSLLLLADNVPRNSVEIREIISVRTDYDEVPVVATVTPLLLLAVVVFIFSILLRTVFKWYFFPPISSPRGSTAGQWLMDPNPQKTAERNILDIEDFQVTDVLGEKSLIMVCPNSQHSSEENLHEDTSLLSNRHLIIKTTEYVSNASVIMDHQLVSLQSLHPDYAVNCHHPDIVFFSEESRKAKAALLHQPHEVVALNSCFPQNEQEHRPCDLSETLYRKETDVTYRFHEFMLNTINLRVYQMTCETEHVDTSFLGKTDVQTLCGQTDCSYLICETNYIANSCCGAKAADEDKTSD
ncbi:interleukin-6 receptor subunit beta isoform X2 [Larimichthys crocea]|uniref:interleukin-6 receptor subunit beta isoform X2 n=1 Tax=Larimichthys crocea TaxID=215358 RepID=UPI000F5E7CB6|nr:interleukin-6 receptor subunit beta isoform X2 [Larimichthys crocea]